MSAFVVKPSTDRPGALDSPQRRWVRKLSVVDGERRLAVVLGVATSCRGAGRRRVVRLSPRKPARHGTHESLRAVFARRPGSHFRFRFRPLCGRTWLLRRLLGVARAGVRSGVMWGDDSPAIGSSVYLCRRGGSQDRGPRGGKLQARGRGSRRVPDSRLRWGNGLGCICTVTARWPDCCRALFLTVEMHRYAADITQHWAVLSFYLFVFSDGGRWQGENACRVLARRKKDISVLGAWRQIWLWRGGARHQASQMPRRGCLAPGVIADTSSFYLHLAQWPARVKAAAIAQTIAQSLGSCMRGSR